MLFFTTKIHSLIKASKTGGAIDGTASGYISSPEDVLSALKKAFSSDANKYQCKRGKNKVNLFQFSYSCRG
jgi:hypothetical protein